MRSVWRRRWSSAKTMSPAPQAFLRLIVSADLLAGGCCINDGADDPPALEWLCCWFLHLCASNGSYSFKASQPCNPSSGSEDYIRLDYFHGRGMRVRRYSLFVFHHHETSASRSSEVLWYRYCFQALDASGYVSEVMLVFWGCAACLQTSLNCFLKTRMAFSFLKYGKLCYWTTCWLQLTTGAI